tara:strand:- start:446 stop:685 length:240 start_codon:yes stop_codon:yes gene_type:complete
MSLAQSRNSGNVPGLALRAVYGLGIEYRKPAKVPVVVMKRPKSPYVWTFCMLKSWPGIAGLSSEALDKLDAEPLGWSLQ